MVFFPAVLLSSEKYDINKNGEIDLEDAQLALRLALKIDTDKDFESVSLTDVQSILNHALEI